jgi:hypothetical protein
MAGLAAARSLGCGGRCNEHQISRDGRAFSFRRRDMADARVLANQKSILKNQNTILANQKKLMANQKKLDELLAGQKAIKANQAKILSNQDRILSKR